MTFKRFYKTNKNETALAAISETLVHVSFWSYGIYLSDTYCKPEEVEDFVCEKGYLPN